MLHTDKAQRIWGSVPYFFFHMKDIDLIKPLTIVHVGTEHLKEFVRQLYDCGYHWGIFASLEQALEASEFFSQLNGFGEKTSIFIARCHKFSFVSTSDPLFDRTKCVFLEYAELPDIKEIAFDDIDEFL